MKKILKLMIKGIIALCFLIGSLLAFLTINLILNIEKYKMFSIKKAPLFIFHIAFVIIIFGAAVTRYIGYEGTMHIREGSSASTMISSDTYFNVEAKVGDKQDSTSETLYLSKRGGNSITSSLIIVPFVVML